MIKCNFVSQPSQLFECSGVVLVHEVWAAITDFYHKIDVIYSRFQELAHLEQEPHTFNGHFSWLRWTLPHQKEIETALDELHRVQQCLEKQGEKNGSLSTDFVFSRVGVGLRLLSRVFDIGSEMERQLHYFHKEYKLEYQCQVVMEDDHK